MSPSVSGFPSRPALRQPAPLPVGSVLAQAERRPQAVVTIGRWRIIATPTCPLQAAAPPAPGPAGAAGRELSASRRPPDHRPGQRQDEAPLQQLPVPAPPPAAGGSPGLAHQDARRDGPLPPHPAEPPAPIEPTSAAAPVTADPMAAAMPPLPRRGPRAVEPAAAAPLGRRSRRSRRAAVPSARNHPLFGALQADPLRRAPLPRSPRHGSALGWALLSQVFWIPLLAIDLHDRWVAHQRDVTPPGHSQPSAPIARATPFRFPDLFEATRPVQQLAGRANQAVGSGLSEAARGAAGSVGTLLSRAGASATSLLDRPLAVSLEVPSRAGSSAAAATLSGRSSVPLAHSLLGRAFTRAQLLGGSIGLGDLQEGPMAPLALVEQALQRSSGDPLAPLPSLWREPMRQALLRLPGAPLQVSPARAVIVPSGAVSRPVQVPLALQSDGSVDVLEAPDDPAVLREIEGWSRQQRLPPSGSLQPALVHLHPLPSEAPLTPAAVPPAGPSGIGRPVAASTPRTTPQPVAAEAPLPLPGPAETPRPVLAPPAAVTVRPSPAAAAASSATPSPPSAP